MRALVPVSVRVEDEHGQGGNRIVVMRGPLPVYIADPVQRLRFVSHAMDGLKESKQALGAEVIAGAQNFAPPTILAQASRLNFSTRLFNLLVTNVPGPQFPLYVLGREMLEVYPVAFLPENHALAIGDHVLQRTDELRAARRLRRPARHRRDQRQHRRRASDARIARARVGQRPGLVARHAPSRARNGTHSARAARGAARQYWARLSRRASSSAQYPA